MTSIPQRSLLIDENPTAPHLTRVAFTQIQPHSTLTGVSSAREALELLECNFTLSGRGDVPVVRGIYGRVKLVLGYGRAARAALTHTRPRAAR